MRSHVQANAFTRKGKRVYMYKSHTRNAFTHLSKRVFERLVKHIYMLGRPRFERACVVAMLHLGSNVTPGGRVGADYRIVIMIAPSKERVIMITPNYSLNTIMIISLTLGRRVTVVVLLLVHSFYLSVHRATENSVHFFVPVKV